MSIKEDSKPNAEAQTEIATWIFQANPSRYRIEESLRIEPEEYWNLNQHWKKIKKGDRVLIWISGEQSGIYALGKIVTEPEKRPDSDKGISYWSDPRDGRKIRPRVIVRYDELFFDNPLLKLFLQYDPALWNLSVIRSPRGTNFPVTTEEWGAIQEWLDRKLNLKA